MTRKGCARCCAPRFVLENSRHSARDARSAMGLALASACLIGVLGALARALLNLAFLRRTKGHTCASGLGEADGNRLLGGSGSMLAAADFVNLFANEFARLGRGRLARALVFTCSLDCSLIRHHDP